MHRIPPVDILIGDYAAKLRKIYRDRTAGDSTFEGVLTELFMEVKKSQNEFWEK